MMQKAPNQTDRTSGPCQDAVGEAGPAGRHLRAERPEPRDGEVQPERQAQLLALEPARDRRRDGDDQRLGAEPEQQPAGRHDRDDRRHAARRRTPTRRRFSSAFTPIPSGARAGVSGHAVTTAPTKQMTPNSIVDFFVPMRSMIDAADEHHHDVREAVDRLQEADARVVEALLAEQRRQRADAVVHVVVAEHRQADEHEHQPAIEAGRPRAARRESGRSCGELYHRRLRAQGAGLTPRLARGALSERTRVDTRRARRRWAGGRSHFARFAVRRIARFAFHLWGSTIRQVMPMTTEARIGTSVDRWLRRGRRRRGPSGPARTAAAARGAGGGHGHTAGRRVERHPAVGRGRRRKAGSREGGGDERRSRAGGSRRGGRRRAGTRKAGSRKGGRLLMNTLADGSISALAPRIASGAISSSAVDRGVPGANRGGERPPERVHHGAGRRGARGRQARRRRDRGRTLPRSAARRADLAEGPHRPRGRADHRRVAGARGLRGGLGCRR